MKTIRGKLQKYGSGHTENNENSNTEEFKSTRHGRTSLLSTPTYQTANSEYTVDHMDTDLTCATGRGSEYSTNQYTIAVHKMSSRSQPMPRMRRSQKLTPHLSRMMGSMIAAIGGGSKRLSTFYKEPNDKENRNDNNVNPNDNEEDFENFRRLSSYASYCPKNVMDIDASKEQNGYSENPGGDNLHPDDESDDSILVRSLAGERPVALSDHEEIKPKKTENNLSYQYYDEVTPAIYEYQLQLQKDKKLKAQLHWKILQKHKPLMLFLGKIKRCNRYRLFYQLHHFEKYLYTALHSKDGLQYPLLFTFKYIMRECNLTKYPNQEIERLLNMYPNVLLPQRVTQKTQELEGRYAMMEHYIQRSEKPKLTLIAFQKIIPLIANSLVTAAREEIRNPLHFLLGRLELALLQKTDTNWVRVLNRNYNFYYERKFSKVLGIRPTEWIPGNDVHLISVPKEVPDPEKKVLVIDKNATPEKYKRLSFQSQYRLNRMNAKKVMSKGINIDYMEPINEKINHCQNKENTGSNKQTLSEGENLCSNSQCINYKVHDDDEPQSPIPRAEIKREKKGFPDPLQIYFPVKNRRRICRQCILSSKVSLSPSRTVSVPIRSNIERADIAECQEIMDLLEISTAQDCNHVWVVEELMNLHLPTGWTVHRNNYGSVYSHMQSSYITHVFPGLRVTQNVLQILHKNESLRDTVLFLRAAAKKIVEEQQEWEGPFHNSGGCPTYFNNKTDEIRSWEVTDHYAYELTLIQNMIRRYKSILLRNEPELDIYEKIRDDEIEYAVRLIQKIWFKHNTKRKTKSQVNEKRITLKETQKELADPHMMRFTENLPVLIAIQRITRGCFVRRRLKKILYFLKKQLELPIYSMDRKIDELIIFIQWWWKVIRLKLRRKSNEQFNSIFLLLKCNLAKNKMRKQAIMGIGFCTIPEDGDRDGDKKKFSLRKAKSIARCVVKENSYHGEEMIERPVGPKTSHTNTGRSNRSIMARWSGGMDGITFQHYITYTSRDVHINHSHDSHRPSTRKMTHRFEVTAPDKEIPKLKMGQERSRRGTYFEKSSGADYNKLLMQRVSNLERTDEDYYDQPSNFDDNSLSKSDSDDEKNVSFSIHTNQIMHGRSSNGTVYLPNDFLEPQSQLQSQGGRIYQKKSLGRRMSLFKTETLEETDLNDHQPRHRKCSRETVVACITENYCYDEEEEDLQKICPKKWEIYQKHRDSSFGRRGTEQIPYSDSILISLQQQSLLPTCLEDEVNLEEKDTIKKISQIKTITLGSRDSDIATQRLLHVTDTLHQLTDLTDNPEEWGYLHIPGIDIVGLKMGTTMVGPLRRPLFHSMVDNNNKRPSTVSSSLSDFNHDFPTFRSQFDLEKYFGKSFSCNLPSSSRCLFLPITERVQSVEPLDLTKIDIPGTFASRAIGSPTHDDSPSPTQGLSLDTTTIKMARSQSLISFEKLLTEDKLDTESKISFDDNHKNYLQNPGSKSCALGNKSLGLASPNKIRASFCGSIPQDTPLGLLKKPMGLQCISEKIGDDTNSLKIKNKTGTSFPETNIQSSSFGQKKKNIMDDSVAVFQTASIPVSSPTPKSFSSPTTHTKLKIMESSCISKRFVLTKFKDGEKKRDMKFRTVGSNILTSQTLKS